MHSDAAEKLHANKLIADAKHARSPELQLVMGRVQMVVRELANFDARNLPDEVERSLYIAQSSLNTIAQTWSPDVSLEHETAMAAEFRQILDQTEDRLKAAKLVRAEQQLKEATRQLETSKALEDAIAVEKEMFARLSQRNFWEVVIWSSLAGIFAICAIAYVMYETHSNTTLPMHMTMVNLAHELGPRVLVVSLFTFLAVTCATNARAANHNRTLNDRRHAGLAAFPYFKKAATGETQLFRDVVLKAMDPLYGGNPTGYIEGEHAKETVTSAGLIAKTVKDIAGK